MERIEAERLIFLDESGVTTEMTRRYGRALGSARVQEGTPAGHWKMLTVLRAVGQSGSGRGVSQPREHEQLA